MRSQNNSLGSLSTRRSGVEEEVNQLLQPATSNIFVTFCRGNPTTPNGKLIQLVKMITLTLLPSLGLLVLLIIDVNTNMTTQASNQDIRDVVQLSKETLLSSLGLLVMLIIDVLTNMTTNASNQDIRNVGLCVHYLQRERGYTAMYASREYSNAINILMQESFRATDNALKKLSVWPDEVEIEIESTTTKFPTRMSFENALQHHRVILNFHDNKTLMSEMLFYNSLIDSFITWMYQSIKFPQDTDDWRHLVAYLLLMSSKNDMGVERTIGSIFYLYGKFKNYQDYIWYLQKYSMGIGNLHTSQLFYPRVAAMLEERVKAGRWNMSTIEEMRAQIKTNVNITGSLTKSLSWFKNTTLYLDAIFEVQDELAKQILNNINQALYKETARTVASIITLVIILLICLVIVFSVRVMVSEIQRYAHTLSDQTHELREERRKAESLLYQMLPPAVATQLKHNQNVPAQSYDDATIFFSDIVGFTVISASCSPLDVVTLLNTLYSCFDSRLELYDVYKVETIGDAYMVSSGVPRSNGRRHVTEIATMALDLSHHVKHIEIPHLPGRDLQLRAGINTGPVVAGVVGSKMPRYCLFGDTVNTASRMESTGEADMIQVSRNTYHALHSMASDYTLKLRGTIDIKGKGKMETYWLLDKEGIEKSLPCMPGCRKFHDTISHRIHSKDQQFMVE
ncbi:hypothetical protein ACOMHN_015317 [Nucella lapillus]